MTKSTQYRIRRRSRPRNLPHFSDIGPVRAVAHPARCRPAFGAGITVLSEEPFAASSSRFTQEDALCLIEELAADES